MSLTAAAFLLTFATGLGLAVLRNPIYGLYTYVAVFYLDAPHRWWGTGLPDLRWSLIAAGVTAVSLLRVTADSARPPWYRTLPAVWLIAYTTWLLIQSPWALDPAEHRECLILFAKFTIVYFLVYRLIDTPARVADFLLAHVLGCLYLGLIALGMDVPGGRLDGVGGPGIDDSNTLGMHAATAAIVGAMLIFATRGWRRAAAVISAPFILNMIVQTGSRGAFLALFAGGVTLLVLRPREKTRLFLALAIVAVLGFGYVASATFWERMQTIESAVKQDADIDDSAEGRIEQFKAGIRMFAAHPLGVGHRGFVVLSPSYLEQKYLTSAGARSSHNTFITTLVEQGVPGAVMYSLLWAWVLKECARARGWAKRTRPLLEVSLIAAVSGGLIVVLIGGQFADFLKVEVQIWLLGLLASLEGYYATTSRGSINSGKADDVRSAIAARHRAYRTPVFHKDPSTERAHVGRFGRN
ncbi:MAG: hypothetical protein NAOJABEB_00194 [Steroidobacteraceae bacterium]|nr:hypothetical protein [Steroidobacteraceae bacterium]